MTGEVFKSIASAKAIAFVLVAWGVPVAIGMGAWWLVALPAWQGHLVPAAALRRLDDIDLSGGWIFLLAWVLLSLLLGLNSTFFFRLYEGYYLWEPLAKRWRKTHELHRTNLLRANQLEVAERRANAKPDPARTAEVEKAQAVAAVAEQDVRAHLLPIRRRFTDRPTSGLPNWRDYPEENFLPTALGNRIRAFERYGNSRYGLDVLILWYEFLGVASEQVRDHIEGARQEVEVFLAGSVVFALFGIATLIPLADPATWSEHGWLLLIAGLIGLVISRLIYRRAVSQAEDWGAAVTALVNTHRAAVANAFGVELPETLTAERRLWESVNGFVRSGRSWDKRYDELPRWRPDRADPVPETGLIRKRLASIRRARNS